MAKEGRVNRRGFLKSVFVGGVSGAAAGAAVYTVDQEKKAEPPPEKPDIFGQNVAPPPIAPKTDEDNPVKVIGGFTVLGAAAGGAIHTLRHGKAVVTQHKLSTEEEWERRIRRDEERERMERERNEDGGIVP